MSKKLTVEEVKANFRLVHGDLYDYSLFTEYFGNKIAVPIICREHGVFYQRPNDHLHGNGCPKCKRNKITPEEYFEMARFVHNNFFTYEHAIYTGSNNKITPTCPIHGDFEVKANNHLTGHNCPKCSKEGIKHKITPLPKRKKSTKKLTQDNVIERIRLIHGDKYDTSLVEYKGVSNKIKLICNEIDEIGEIHGIFEITPAHLFGGQGCPKCGGNYRHTTDSIVAKFKMVHKDDYDYSKFIYVDYHTSGEIICPIHGSFYQTPANHLKGKGCPYCNSSRLEREIKHLLDENEIEYVWHYYDEWLGKKSLDFYLPKYDAAIECQGIQHFEPVPIFHDRPDSTFELTIERDRVKSELCKKEGIRLYYYSNLGIDYPYYVYEDKNELIKDIINGQNN